MRIIILGAQGVLGHELAKVFKKHKPLLWDRPELDITNETQVSAKLSEVRPNLVINAAAYTAVDDCETNEQLAKKINGTAVGYLAKTCQQIGAILVHYSTDYVFAGRKAQGYTEKDKPQHPINAYGRSKLLGEIELQKHTDKFYLIRTAWLYGASGKNFVATMIELGRKQIAGILTGAIKVVDDQHGKPTFAGDLALRTHEIIQANNPFGIYHITNETAPTTVGGISWYQFAKEIFRQVVKLKILPRLPLIRPCASGEFPRPAKRPAYSVLINTKLVKSQRWQLALADYLKKVKIN